MGISYSARWNQTWLGRQIGRTLDENLAGSWRFAWLLMSFQLATLACRMYMAKSWLVKSVSFSPTCGGYTTSEKSTIWDGYKTLVDGWTSSTQLPKTKLPWHWLTTNLWQKSCRGRGLSGQKAWGYFDPGQHNAALRRRENKLMIRTFLITVWMIARTLLWSHMFLNKILHSIKDHESCFICR